MSKDDIDAVLERVRSWPKDRQAEALDMLLALEKADEGELFELTPEEIADLESSLEEIERGEVASAQEVAAAFRRVGR